MKKTIFLFIALILSIGSYAQNEPYFRIKGQVIDNQTNYAIPGTNLAIKRGKVKGEWTQKKKDIGSADCDGLFTLDSLQKGDVLIVSFVGYRKKSVPITGPSDSLVVCLNQVAERVMARGYKKAKKKRKHASYFNLYGPAKEKHTAQAIPLFDIKGQVVDEQTGETIPGASLKVRKSRKRVYSNYDGVFTLENIKRGDVLVTSFIGYDPKETFILGPNDSLTIRLKENPERLDDIIVLGYGTPSK